MCFHTSRVAPRLKYSILSPTLPPMLFPYWLQSIGPMDGAALARTVSAGLDFFNMAVQGVRHSFGSINLFLQLGTNISGNDELIGRCTGCFGSIYRNWHTIGRSITRFLHGLSWLLDEVSIARCSPFAGEFLLHISSRTPRVYRVSNVSSGVARRTFSMGGLFIFGIFLRQILELLLGCWFYAFLLFCFLLFLLLCLSASLLFLLLFFSASLLPCPCFPASLLPCFSASVLCLLLFSSASLLSLLLCFSAFVLLCLSTCTILLFLFFSHVFLLLYFLLLCFSASCLYCLFVCSFLLLYSLLFVNTLGETVKPKETLKNPDKNPWYPKP